MKKAIKIGGDTYLITPLDARLAQEFLDHAKTHMPDPVKEVVAASQDIPEGPHRDRFLEKHLDEAFARKRHRGTHTDPDLDDYTRREGHRKLFALLFKRHHPDLTEDEAFDLALKGIEEHGSDVFQQVLDVGQKVPLSERQVEDAFSAPSA